METAHFVLRLLAFSQVLFFCVYLLTYQRSPVGLLISLTAFSFMCYLIAPFGEALGSTVELIIVIAGTSIPGLIWLIAWNFFADDKRIPRWFIPAWLAYMLLALVNWPVDLSPQASAFAFDLVPQIIKLILVLHVIYMALEGKTSDLVNDRLELRVPLAIGAALMTSLVIVVEIWAGDNMPMFVEVLGSTLMALVTLSANIYLFRMHGRWQQEPRITTVEEANPEIESRDLAVIKELMERDRLYAEHGITIGDLASHLTMPEYRLRTIINQGFKVRNFNQFLNSYRIKEAARRLIDEADLPILTIALDVGFKSLSSFNKAFRDTHQQTPTEYRSRES